MTTTKTDRRKEFLIAVSVGWAVLKIRNDITNVIMNITRPKNKPGIMKLDFFILLEYFLRDINFSKFDIYSLEQSEE